MSEIRAVRKPVATDRERPPDKTRPEQGELPFRLTVEWRTGPRTRAWNELWRWLLTDVPEGTGDESHITPMPDGHE